ncbi:MAG: AMP-binding enzyme [Arachnia sp.]
MIRPLVAGDFVGSWDDLPEIELPAAAAAFVGGALDALRVVRHHVAPRTNETLLATAGRKEPGLVHDLDELGLTLAEVNGDDVRIGSASTRHAPTPGRVWLLTSGSTGRPKRVAHTLDTLTTVRGSQPPRTWLNPYTPGAYAWWQVTTLALTQPDQGMVCVDPASTTEWAQAALEYGVDAASGTPTFWRQALMRSGETLSQIGFQQITLGGEPVDQAVIDMLTSAFPEARVSWIYASSEVGAAIAVHDGKAGFPEAWLDRDDPSRPRLSVRDDELVITSPHRGEGVAAELRTGDRVARRDGRVLITGRLASDEINVGGSKVSAGQVREVVMSHPGVAWCAVKGRKAPVVGSLVQADVVLSDPAVTEDDLTRYCAARLAEYAVPRRIRFLDQIPMKESLKSDV